MTAIKSVRIGVVALGFLGYLASMTWAQTGEIAGIVRDSTGGVLPGVTVEAASPALIEKVRSVASDGQGLYKIIDLRPGVYTVSFTLPGFNTFRREGIELSAGFTATVNAEMRVGEVAETITVTGQSPLVDVQNVSQQRVLQREVVEALPTARNIFSVGVLVPGVVVSNAALGTGSQDVGGSVGDGIQALAVHGSRFLQMPYLLDGMRYNNMNLFGGGNTTSFSINPGNISEVAIQVAGQGAEAEVSGIRLNIIPKEGGNAFSGIFVGNFANSAMQANNIDANLRARGVASLTALDKVWDVNPSVGGPLRKDRLWFYTSFRYSGSHDNIPGVYFAKDPKAFAYQPDLSRPAPFLNWVMSANLRLTLQASPRNKFGLYYDHQQRCACEYGMNATVMPEASKVFGNDPNSVATATWNSPITNRFLLEAGFLLHPETWYGRPQSYTTPDMIAVVELSTGVNSRAAAGSLAVANSGNYNIQRDLQYNSKFIAHYVTGSHAFKVGFLTQNGFRHDTSYNLGDLVLFALNRVPVQVQQRTTPIDTTDRMRANIVLYGQDQWKIKRLTVSPGMRFDYFNTYADAVNLPAARFAPARNLPAVYDAPNWKDLSPRLGVVYDLFGTGRTALKAGLNRYLQGMAMRLATANNPQTTTVNLATRPWTDLNGNFVPDCDLTNPAANGECGPLSNPFFGQPNIATRYDPDVLQGWGKRPYDWEVTAGIQHEVRRGLAVTASWIRHSFANKYATKNLSVTPADYTQYCITAPVDARLPTSGQQLCGLYDINPAKFGQVNNLITFAKNFGDAQEVFTGVDLGVSVRLPRGMVLQGGTSTGRLRLNDCFVVYNPGLFGVDDSVLAPGRLRDCAVTPPYQTQMKALAVYPLPGDTVVSVTLQSLAGPEITASYAAPLAQITPSLGRPLSGGALTATVPLVAPGTLYGDRLNQLDFRVAKNIMVGRTRIQPQFDLYNMLNANPVIRLNTTYGAAWQNPLFVLPGRLIKVGAQVTF